MDVLIWVLAILGGLASLILTFKAFFPNPGDFMEALEYLLTPNWLSSLRGEGADDSWASLKFWIYLLLNFGAGAAIYFGLHKWLDPSA